MQKQSKKTFQPGLWATIVTMISLVILGSLGTWQLKRLAWKTNLLAQIEAQGELPAQDFEQYQSALNKGEMDALIFRKTKLSGTFDHDAAIHIYPRLYDEQQGFHVITPLNTDFGVILVNRGWVKTGEDYHKPADTVELTGQFRKPDRKNMFTPPNDVEKNMHYWLDYAAFKIADLPAITIYQSPIEITTQNAEMPFAVDLPTNIPNNHQQYAFFWFAMALILVVIYIMYHMKPAIKAGKDQ